MTDWQRSLLLHSQLVAVLGTPQYCQLMLLMLRPVPHSPQHKAQLLPDLTLESQRTENLLLDPPFRLRFNLEPQPTTSMKGNWALNKVSAGDQP
jgi:hypothetical protein